MVDHVPDLEFARPAEIRQVLTLDMMRMPIGVTPLQHGPRLRGGNAFGFEEEKGAEMTVT